MKTTSALSLLIVLFSLMTDTVGFAQVQPQAKDSSDVYIYDKTAPHGGRLKANGTFIVEMVKSYDKMLVYLYNSNLEPYKNLGITGNVTYRQNDGSFITADLSPFEVDGFTPKMFIASHSLCSVYLNVFGKKVVAHFNNEENMVKKNVISPELAH